MRSSSTARGRRWTEAALVAAVTALSVQEAAVPAGGDLAHPPAIPAVAVALAAGLSLAARHRLPRTVAAVAVVAAGGWALILPLLVALFTLASRHRIREAVGGALVALAANTLLHLRPELSLWVTRSYGPALPLVLALVLGLWAGNHRRLVRALAAQVEHLRVERELREHTARLTERAAIAAEMHDVLAHRLSLIALHTGVLTTRQESLPEPVAERLGLLRTASTEALSDLRDVLGALRDPEGAQAPAPPAPAPLAPAPLAPALRDIGDLVEQAREAGQRVAYEVEGSPHGAPAAHRLAAFRLVQEALTNARKHAPDAPVDVRVRYGPGATDVEVTDSGAAGGTGGNGPVVPSGYGLVGLAERVEALGGRLHAGPGTDGRDGSGSPGGSDGPDAPGGWRVSAHIPQASQQNGTRT